MTLKRLVISVLLAACAAAQTFTNPLLPSGPDPWAIYRDGWYYYTSTTAVNLTLWKTHSIPDLAHAEKRVVWTPPAGTAYSKDLWAPELHFIDGKWYLYFAADDGSNRNHRLWVLENGSADPLAGSWTLKGQIVTPGDHWAIDADVFQVGTQLYLLWSGWPDDQNGEQDIYLCRLSDPWTAAGPRVRISAPQYAWEEDGDIVPPGPDGVAHVNVNEGPEALVRHGRVFVIYSASGCWTDDYALGMVWADASSDLLDAASWHKLATPVFQAGSRTSGTYAAGHNGFFKSPDGTQDWILYHANPEPHDGCGGTRSPRAQRFTWTRDGFPNFGQPVAAGMPLDVPSVNRRPAPDRH